MNGPKGLAVTLYPVAHDVKAVVSDAKVAVNDEKAAVVVALMGTETVLNVVMAAVAELVVAVFVAIDVEDGVPLPTGVNENTTDTLEMTRLV